MRPLLIFLLFIFTCNTTLTSARQWIPLRRHALRLPATFTPYFGCFSPAKRQLCALTFPKRKLQVQVSCSVTIYSIRPRWRDIIHCWCMQNPWSGLLLVISFSSIKSRLFWSHTVEPITMTIKRMMGEERGRNRGGGMCVRVCSAGG